MVAKKLLMSCVFAGRYKYKLWLIRMYENVVYGVLEPQILYLGFYILEVSREKGVWKILADSREPTPTHWLHFAILSILQLISLPRY